jgi:hypothetical protein
MKLYYIKEKKELVCPVLLVISALFGVLILIKVAGFFVASAKAEELVKRVVVQSKPDAMTWKSILSNRRQLLMN